MRQSRPSAPHAAGYSPALYKDDAHKASLEARNALLQFDEIKKLVDARKGKVGLTPQDVLSLQRIAIQDVYVCAGNFRTAPVFIGGTSHQPPEHKDVPRLVDEMCNVVNASDDPLWAGAYLMWRLNWIHPFFGGNGRTSRAIGYLALCSLAGQMLPGTVSVPELIVRDRGPYYAALDAADAAWLTGNLDVSVMKQLLGVLVTEQLRSAGIV